ncbi:antibiotic biosynthesis monooxygenase [Halomarina litorea]|uniref:antibiotic biosynthesis monooxygenase n=1 Tax=Halomarina litorea TaxID=2961595 RepID=UPI0020C40C84|nr:antibiotic biosynthesis monooxygenase [Halomarina sp. BCD28]
MVNVLIRHTVEDYERWKPYFDDHAGVRAEGGERGYRLFRTFEDPNEVVILFEWDTGDNARAFLESEDLRERMHEAGVLGTPEVAILDELEAKTAGEPVA